MLRNNIYDIAAGDDVEIPRSIDIAGISPGTLEKAWFTVKANLTDLDAAAIIQKSVTTTLTDDGQIDVEGSADDGVDAHMFFTLTAADTLLLTPGVFYYFDIKVKSSDGAGRIVEGGRIKTAQPITLATS